MANQKKYQNGTKRVSVIFDTNVISKIESLSAQYNMSRNEAINRMLSKYIDSVYENENENENEYSLDDDY